MAYTSCTESIAKSIAMKCANPLVGGYTGRGVLIPWEALSAYTQDTDNPRKVLSLTLASSAKVVALDNAGLATPLEGSSTAGNADSGMAMFLKTLSARVLTRGADVSMELIEPLVRSSQGFVAILEKKDKIGDGSYEVVGLQSPLKVTDPSSVTRNENENGGAVAFSMTATEYYFELSFVPKPEDGETQWAASKAAFEKMLENAYEA